MKRLRVYIAGPLTDLPTEEERQRVRGIYELIGQICEDEGLQPYIPHLHTDPIKHAEVLDAEVNRIDKEQVKSCDLLLGYDGFPSRGMAMEVQICEYENITAILYREPGKSKSRMLSGSDAVGREIIFEYLDQLTREIRESLRHFKRKRTRDGFEIFAHQGNLSIREYERLRAVAARGEGPYTPEDWEELYKQLEPGI